MSNNLQTALKKIAESIDTSSITATTQPTVKKMLNQMIDSVDPQTFKITNEMSQQLVASINFTSIHKKVVEGRDFEYEEVFESTHLNDVSDEEKEELIEAALAANPVLAERVNSELALTTLSKEQKTMFKWLAVILFIFAGVLGSAAIGENADLSAVYETLSRVGDFSSLVLLAKKATSNDEPETDSSESTEDND